MTGRIRYLFLGALIVLQTVMIVQLTDLQRAQTAVFHQQEKARDQQLVREIAGRKREEALRLRVMRATLIRVIRELHLSDKRERELLAKIRDAFRVAAPPSALSGGGTSPPPEPSPTPPPKPSPSCEPACNSDQCKPDQAHG